jgi:hypothetical protein
MPVQLLNLELDQAASFTASFAWISGGQGVDVTGTTATAVFRQLATDPPLVTVSTTPNANGSITYLPAIPNFPWVPRPDAEPVLITLYPIQLQLTLAGVALIDVAYCQWKCTITWPSGTAIVIASGSVEVDSV